MWVDRWWWWVRAAEPKGGSAFTPSVSITTAGCRGRLECSQSATGETHPCSFLLCSRLLCSMVLLHIPWTSKMKASDFSSHGVSALVSVVLQGDARLRVWVTWYASSCSSVKVVCLLPILFVWFSHHTAASHCRSPRLSRPSKSNLRRHVRVQLLLHTQPDPDLGPGLELGLVSSSS